MKKVGSDTRGGVGYSGFDSLAVANERMQQSINFEKQSAAQRNQIAQTTTQALQVSSQGKASAQMHAIAAEEAADQKQIAAKAQPGGGAIGQIAAAIGGAAQTYMNVKAKDRELDVAEHQLRTDIAYKEEQQLAAEREAAAKAAAEALKEQRAQNYVKANDELQLFTQTNIKEGKLTLETGLSEFRVKASDIINKYDLDPEAQRQLSNYLYENIKTVNGRQIDDITTLNKEIRAQSTDIVRTTIVTQLSGLLTMAGSDRPEVRAAALPAVQQGLNDMLAREDLEPLEKLTITNDVMERLMNNYAEGTKEHQDAQDSFNDYRKMHYEIAKADQKYNSGEWDINERYAYLVEKAIANRIPISAISNYDPNAASVDAINSLERSEKMKDLREKQVVDAGALIDYTNEEVAVLTIEILAKPSLINELKTRAAYRENPDVKTAIDNAEKYNKYRELNAADRTTRARILTQIRQVEQGGVKYLISQRKAASTPDIAKVMAAALSGTPFEGDAAEGMTDAEIAANEGALQNVLQSLQEQAALLDQQMNDRVTEMKGLGLGDLTNFEALQKTNAERSKALTARVDALTAAASQQPPKAGIGIASPTNAGGNKPAFGGVKALEVWKSPHGKVVMPLKAGTKFGMRGRNMHFGAPRDGGARKHKGEDIGVPVGTPVVAYVGMTLREVGRQMTDKGGGYWLSFDGDDGKVHRFLHLKDYSAKVRPGQRVEAGGVLAISGDTGAGDAHLHWEIRTKDGQALDPLQYMASMTAKTTTLKAPVGNTKNIPSYEPGVIQPRMPSGARPLGMGEYLYKGQTYQMGSATPTAKPETRFNPAKPVRAGRSSNNSKTYDNKKVQNYGYGNIAKDEAFLAEAHKVADRLGTSAQWLIDVMAYETGGTFSTGIPNQAGSGAVGLIQFMPETAAKLGTTTQKLAKMSRLQQLKYVEKYMSQYKNDLGKGVEFVLAAIWGGENLIQRLKDAPYEAYMWSDGVKGKDGKRKGGIRFHQYLDKLGRHVGRRYDGAWTRKDKLISSNTHTVLNSDCKMCIALVENDNPLVPHEAQLDLSDRFVA